MLFWRLGLPVLSVEDGIQDTYTVKYRDCLKHSEPDGMPGFTPEGFTEYETYKLASRMELL